MTVVTALQHTCIQESAASLSPLMSPRVRPSVLLHLHREGILAILRQYQMFSHLRVIGSVARGDDTSTSDIDFLVDAAQDATLFDLGDFSEDLQDLLGIPVDIITKGDIMANDMKELILREAKPV